MQLRIHNISPMGVKVHGVVARILARIGACADELRLMGVERAEVLANMGSAIRRWDSVARNVTNDRFPPSM